MHSRTANGSSVQSDTNGTITADHAPIQGLDDLEYDDASCWPSWTDADTWTTTADDDGQYDANPEGVYFWPEQDSAEPTLADWQDYFAAKRESEARAALDHSATLSLPALAEHIARHFASFGTDAGDLFALTMSDLAGAIRATGASTVEEFRARDAVLAAHHDDCPCRACVLRRTSRYAGY